MSRAVKGACGAESPPNLIPPPLQGGGADHHRHRSSVFCHRLRVPGGAPSTPTCEHARKIVMETGRQD